LNKKICYVNKINTTAINADLLKQK